jgi:L-2-hydroxyglutarate oxidase LhgO
MLERDRLDKGTNTVTDSLDTVVIGAGAIGLAIARALARAGREVVILEAAKAVGTGVSARNSEVIHAGLYYPTGSLKARLCVDGNRMLRDFLEERGIAFRMTGKLIVATDAEEEARLEVLHAQGLANGVEGLTPFTEAGIRTMEPALRCRAGLQSTTTGIFDSHAYMLALLADAEAAGATLALDSPVTGGAVTDGGILLAVGGAEPSRVLARQVVNAAGLGAQKIAAGLAGLPKNAVPPLYLCKGSYFQLSGRAPFRRLIYPLPVAGGLGVHFTLDLGGRGRFGPDVEWVETESYAVDPARADAVQAAIRRYWPDLPDGALQPAHAGIRPKIAPPGAPAADFRIDGADVHGVPGLVQLFGIESPGLTASLAIAGHVRDLLS